MFSILMVAALMFVSSWVFAKDIIVDVTVGGGYSILTNVKVWYVNPEGSVDSCTGWIEIPDGAEVTQINIIVPAGYVYVDSTRGVDGDGNEVYTFILAIAQ